MGTRDNARAECVCALRVEVQLGGCVCWEVVMLMMSPPTMEDAFVH